ncbi:glycosyltransferase family 4 protein [Paraburkholderia sp. D1E]|uniref:glycosyltransferase family 4 protein n=1 Tax=Paraburkholderia sp. D1E TaxID=3461398 RepID=UPI0040457600
MSAYLSRRPAFLQLEHLDLTTKIGSPLSPIALGSGLRNRRDAGVFWSPGFVPPLRSPCPSVVTIHDLTHLHYYSRWHRIYYELVFKRLLLQCSAIVCVSEYTKSEFLEWSNIDPKKVHVVLNGVHENFFGKHEPLNYKFKYILYPGNRRKYKNLDRLFAAYAASVLPKQNVKLMLTGIPSAELTLLARKLGIEANVVYSGIVSDQDMPRLYSGALMVVFVSLYEGFGLPIVEGMASGVPVITSNVSAMAEIGDSAAELVDPYSVDSIKEAINKIATDKEARSDLIRKSAIHVKKFDWGKSACRLWEIVGEFEN